MRKSTFERVSFAYNFVEEHITRDYRFAIKHMDKYLTIKYEDRIVDIGSGTCKIAEKLSNKVKNIINIDPSKALLSKNKNLIKIQADGTHIPIKNDVFDKIFLINVLHHIDQKHHDKFFLEAHRILKRNGKLLLIDLRKPKKLAEKMFARFDQFTSGGKTFYYNADEMKKKLHEIGFSKIEWKKLLDDYPEKKDMRYIFIAEK